MFRTSVNYALIDVVAKEKDLSIQNAHRALHDKGISTSLPNFYKTVARMVDDQILIRHEGKLKFHTLFLSYIHHIGQETQGSRDDEQNLLNIAVGKQRTRQAKSLYELHSLRSDLLAQLAKTHSGSESSHYTSHPYYLLSLPQKEKVHMEELAGSLNKSFFLIGNETVLDRYACQLLPRELYTSTCTSNPPFPSEGYFMDIIGDYIVECMIPQAVNDVFTMFFTTIVGVEGYKKEAFLQLLKMKVPCSLKLIHSPEHAKKMQMKIAKQFEGKALGLKMAGKSV